MAVPNDIVLFHYPFSPFGRRIVWYLALRGIEYAQCIQPVTLPREDLNALGVKYRRIPILSVGRDIYCDTRLIIQKLEARFPDGALGATDPNQKAVEKLLESWTIDGGIFARAAQAIPAEMSLMRDPKFIKDREEYTGRSWSQESVKILRPEALVHLKEAFDLLEQDLLADGREWVLKTERPSLADINAIWPFHWLLGMKVALPPDLFSTDHYPKTFAWVDRFGKALKVAGGAKPMELKGAEALQHILQAQFEPECDVDDTDPTGLERGVLVESWPVDSGFKHHDQGRLVGLSPHEMILETQTKVAGKVVRIHHPRHNFRVRAVGIAAKF